MPTLANKLESLRTIIRGFGSVLVAYSGGVDSALVLAVAHEQLGERALGCIGCSPSYPRRELDAAASLARHMGANLRLIETREHLDPSYAANPSNRCFFCKSELYRQLSIVAADEGWAFIADGSNLDDIGDHHHGMSAAAEKRVRSPLLEARLQKAEVRALARALQVPAWDKPASPCLSSRVPHGTAITPQILKMIETAEDALLAMGFAQLRVRHHGQAALIEIPPDEFARALELREPIVHALHAAGYAFVALDLAGFRSGSLNLVPLSVHRSAPLSPVQ